MTRSLRDTVHVRWEPTDLTARDVPAIHPPHLPTLPAAPLPVFVPDGAAAACSIPMPLFEVTAAAAGIPDAVLAPARRRAEAAGYLAGWQRGVAVAEQAAAGERATQRQRADAQHAAGRNAAARAADAVRDAAAVLERRAAPVVGEIEQMIVDAAFQIAEALVGRALADDTDRGRTAVARALALTPRGERIVVAVSPADGAALAQYADEFGGDVEIVADPTLAAGDAVATSGALCVDARLGAGLDRVRTLLAGEVAG